MQRAPFINLPLHSGHAPAYLIRRMIRLSHAMSKVIIDEYGGEKGRAEKTSRILRKDVSLPVKLKYHLNKLLNMAKIMVGKASEIGEGKMTHVTAGGKEILVANVGGAYYATGNICTHAGAELHEGTLEGKELTCPWHGSKWDITTGSMTWFPQKLRELGRYKVMVENGTVYVEV